MRAATLIGLILALGCADDVADSCPSADPTPFGDIELKVTGADGGPVDGVQASLSAESFNLPMHCNSNATATYCSPTGGGSPGSYLLEIKAPGFEDLTVDAVVVFKDIKCGETASMTPSAVTLTPVKP
jgi:hypothetical protein